MPDTFINACSLQTLGGLSLGTVQEPKPLLLLAYLLIEGATPRDRLAQLLWAGTADPKNNLRVSLCKLRGWGVTVTTDGEYLSAEHPSDHLAGEASGPGAEFLWGVDLSGVSPELEDWVFTRREGLAAQAQEALLREAARVTDREELLGRAWCVPGAPLPSAGTLARFLSLCRAGTALHGSLSAELAELWDGTLPTQEPLAQALLAGWLEGGATWLAGDAAKWQRPMGSVQALLEADGQSVLSLHVPPGMAAQAYAHELGTQVARACQDGPAQALTVVLRGEADTLNSAALAEALTGWLDVRFVVLGGAPAAGVGLGLTLHAPALRGGRPAGSPHATRASRPAAHARTRPAGRRHRDAGGDVTGHAHSVRHAQKPRHAHGATGPPPRSSSNRVSMRGPDSPGLYTLGLMPPSPTRPSTERFPAQLRKGSPDGHD
ncbi:hypothetical protein M8445_16555 (plasmid) [Deinococcus aquaticus]|uniref:Bacterial transcriptional activator domain-containing protein n=1 Tax=Deinococcus aquaticus TaxID=328692 RepID=A0ABY7V517_9DEIO|nr:hypothetical protein [Deinococcus aquaticus]WDA60302.1 hypothetical protein M8445_16555 [Deinococcus aquaticus]